VTATSTKLSQTIYVCTSRLLSKVSRLNTSLYSALTPKKPLMHPVKEKKNVFNKRQKAVMLDCW